VKYSQDPDIKTLKDVGVGGKLIVSLNCLRTIENEDEVARFRNDDDMMLVCESSDSAIADDLQPPFTRIKQVMPCDRAIFANYVLGRFSFTRSNSRPS
jgi:hypothetical protein